MNDPYLGQRPQYFDRRKKQLSWDMIQLGASCIIVRKLIEGGYCVVDFHQEGFISVFEVEKPISLYGSLMAYIGNYTFEQATDTKIWIRFNQHDYNTSGIAH